MFLLLAIAGTATALNIAYCSSENTGSDFAAVTNHFQSNGACFQTCNARYAFAVLQGSDCWCSNYVPADTTSTDSCSQPCPGYPSDLCGSSSDNLFGYIALKNSPSGTAGHSSNPTSTSAPITASSIDSQVTPSTTANVRTTQAISSSSTPSSSTTLPSTSSTPASSTSITPASSASITPPSSTSSTSTTAAVVLAPVIPATTLATSLATTWTPTPMTSVITVTGQVKTITITPTQPAAATGAPLEQKKSDGGFLTHTGKVVGLFVGVALIILIAAALAISCFLRRRRARAAAAAVTKTGGETPQRRPSRLSQMCLVGQTTGAGEKYLPSIRTSGWGPSIGGEKSPDDITPADARVVDQRLDPVTVWNPLHTNGSHISVQSFRDDQDYSRRMLRVANPDL
ncbi:Carbohydrate-binding WSC, subgroup [Lasallia pustulata]|uniref:Carbohydrate-binding WSC, subgroup n=1 Tax=Lasallia pustulata TaxID=136370 RepID=A0A1W5CTF7_9LECA|nr:Carbohydrate-binding WSC, subgroup [Lasallia pustulata]